MNEKLKELKKDEKIRSIQLQNKQKGYLKMCNKNKDKFLDNVCDFQKELSALSDIYDRKISPEVNSFISYAHTTKFDLIEESLNEDINRYLDNLKDIQGGISKAENKKYSSISEFDYQSSLYLKHEAKMLEIDAKAELASLEAEIECLHIDTYDEETSDDDLTKEINDIIDEIGFNLKKLFTNRVVLRLREEVMVQLSSRQEISALMHELSELCRRQYYRGRMHLTALDRELEVHNNLLEVLQSIPQIQSSLVTLSEQLKSIESALVSKESRTSVNDGKLEKLKSEGADSRGSLSVCLNRGESLLEACERAKREKTNILWSITDQIENSRNCLDQILADSGEFNGTLQGNRALGKSDRPSLVSAAHSDQFVQLQDSAKESRARLKTIKDSVKNFGMDVQGDEGR